MRLRVSRAIVPVLILATVFYCASPGSAQGALAEVMRRVSIEFRMKPLREAVADFSKASGLKVEIAMDVPDPRITVSIRDLPADKALKALIEGVSTQQGKLRLSRNGDAWKIERPESPDKVQTREVDGYARLTFVFKDIPLRTALERIFANSNEQYSIDPKVPNVRITVSGTDVSLQQALRMIIREAAKQVPGLTQSKG